MLPTKPQTAMADSTVVSVTPPYTLVKTQNNFSVSIVLTDGTPFAFFEVTIDFNITAVKALNGRFAVPNGSLFEIDNGAGTVIMAGYNYAYSNQTLANVTFQALGQGNSTLHLTDTYVGGIPVATEDAVVEVVGPINLTVASLRRFYYAGTDITILGNLTSAGSPVNGLVGLELETSHGFSLVRTVASGPGPLEDSWPMNVTSFYPSDNQGNPTSGFLNGTQAYFDVQVQSLATVQMNYLIFIDVLDAYNASIGETWTTGLILAGGTVSSISGINVPPGACNGSATAYAEVFSDWPHNNGVPYCPEQNATFMITGGPNMVSKPVNYSTVAFSSDFAEVLNLSSQYSYGNYSVYATANYKTFLVTANTTFFNTVLCDFNDNGMCDTGDLGWLLRAWRPSVPFLLPDADLNHDGKINSSDLGIFLRQFSKHEHV